MGVEALNEASSPYSEPPKRNLFVWIGITKEILGVPSDKVGVPPGWGCGVGKLKFFVLNLLAYLLNQILCSEVSVSHQHLHVPMT